MPSWERLYHGKRNLGAVSIRGIEPLLARLNRLDSKLRRKIMKQTISKAAKPMIKAARANIQSKTDKETGALKKSIGAAVRSYRKGASTIAVIGPRRKMGLPNQRGKITIPTLIAHLVEGGTKAHDQPRHWWFRRSGHPGARPRPFLEPAYVDTETQMMTVIAEELTERIYNEA